VDKEGKIEKRFMGVAASPGISIGYAHLIIKTRPTLSGILIDVQSIPIELEKFEDAIRKSMGQLERLKDKAKSNLEEVDILESHIELLQDPQINDEVTTHITEERNNALDAVTLVVNKMVQLFEGLDDAYLRARSADIRDIGGRIVENLQGNHKVITPLGPNSIVLAKELSPSDTIAMDLEKVLGFATETGGAVSHTAILAKSNNVPAVLGCGELLETVIHGDHIIVDGIQGIVIVNPDENIKEEYRQKQVDFIKHKTYLNSLKEMPAITNDGVGITLLANISNDQDMKKALEYGAKGAGLLRTELMYMEKETFPTEEEQYQFYKSVAIHAQGTPVTIRTLDVGGDKPLGYFDLPNEENPFLGYRAIRISLDQQEIFSTQLRAILRAGVHGNLKIMFPMISNVMELRKAKEILSQVKEELFSEGIAFAPNIPVGIMIEVPSAAIMADVLAKEVDFFSIGTNDLCQYTLAVDRGNENIKQLYDPFDPAVLRLVHQSIERANDHNISVSVCGELASDTRATLLLLGMGLREFSMSSTAIPEVKDIIRKHDIKKAKKIWNHVMNMDHSKSITDYLEKHI
jgi:phosphotransferase system enzyme I (PtsI)